jgi:thiol:disulfide interchange protein DsbD
MGLVSAQQSTIPDALGRLVDKFVTNQDELLEPDQAFKLAISVRGADTVQAEFTPAPSYYLYRDRVKFNVEGSDAVKVLAVDMPQGEAKDDPIFGQTRVFHHPFSALVRLQREAGASDQLKLKATFQGCSEKGVCYPPINKTFNLVLAASGGSPALPLDAGKSVGRTDMETGAIDNLRATGGLLWVVGAFFIVGIGLAFTPCVLPMIPILSGIIAGQGQAVTRKRGAALSLSYVLGMAITYALVGVAAGLSGALISAALQNAWVLGTFALIFVVLALSMFGLYELQVPSIIQDRAQFLSNRLSGGKLAAVFGMGALSALIVSPCVAAPLAGALLYIGQTRDAALGGSALFAMALGMGVPLLAVGISAGTLLPRSGPWMNSVKRFFGVLLLAVAIWVISPVVPVVVQMLLWAALFIVSAIFLRATDPLASDATPYARLAKGLGMIALVAGIALLVGALSGSRDPLQPLAALRSGPAASELADVGFEPVRSVAELDERLRTADRPVMLDFYADWCVACKEMERFTFSDARVADRLQDMLLLQADVTANSPDDQALLKRFGLFGPPGIIFFNDKGKELRRLRVIGYQPADSFLRTVDDVLNVGTPGDKPTLTSLPPGALSLAD